MSEIVTPVIGISKYMIFVNSIYSQNKTKAITRNNKLET